MSTTRFSRYVLRTTSVAEAETFYDAVLRGRGDAILQLHEGAVARGAKPHWLGVIDVSSRGSTEDVADRFVARGAARLGPGAGGVVVVRDPGGALVGITTSSESSRAAVAWHQLNTMAAPRAAAHYEELFGWSVGIEIDLGVLGTHRPFSFRAGEAAVGGIAAVEGRPEVHAHWLYFFAVPALERAVAEVVARGGKVVGPTTLPDGKRVAACDDSQGAAFGLIEVAPADQ